MRSFHFSTASVLLLVSAGLFSERSYADGSDNWVAPVTTYINLQSGLSADDDESSIIVTQPGGDRLTAIYDSEPFVARVLLSSAYEQLVEVSLDDINWFVAIAENGAYTYDFGLLPIGESSLLVRVDNEQQTPIVFQVSELVLPPERIVSGLAPNEVGVEQSFTMSWDAADNSDSYTVLVQSGQTGEAILQSIEGVTSNSVVLSHDTIEVIIVRVRACNSGGCSTAGATRIVNVLGNVPDTVSLVNTPTQAYVDQDIAVTWSSVSGATEYKVYLAGSVYQTVTGNAASVTRNQSGEVLVGVAACNANGCSAPTSDNTVTVVLDPNTPITLDDLGGLQVLTRHTFDVLANDTDPNGGPLTLLEVTKSPTRGTATIADNNIEYENTVGACGGVDSFSDSLTYKVSNEQGLVSESATLDITINCQAEGHWVELPVPYNTPILDYNLYAGEQDYYLKADATQWLMLGRLPFGIYAEYSFIRLYKNDGVWQSAIATQQEFSSYVYSGSIDDAVGQITDLDAADYYSVNLNYDFETAPTAVADNSSYELNTATDIYVTTNDLGPSPQNIILTAITNLPAYGSAIISPDKNAVVYTPNTDSCETDSFEYQITNNNQQTSTAQVNLSCMMPLVANDDSAEYAVNQFVDVDVLENDITLGSEGLTITVSANPTSGVLSVLNNTVSYQPNTDSCETDSFEYQITNNNQQTSTAQVNLSCMMPLVANDDSAEYAANQFVDVDVLENDITLGSEGLTITVSANPTSGVLSVLNNIVSYQPTTDSCVADSASYLLTNSLGQTSYADITFNCTQVVSPVPAAVDDEASYQLGGDVLVPVLENDTYPLLPALTITIKEQPYSGTVMVVDREILYTPSSGMCSDDSVEYTLTNEHGSSNATVNLVCTTSHWATPSVTVGQPATVIWFEPNAQYCQIVGTDVQYSGSQGEANISFYTTGEMAWQCFDESNLPTSTPITIVVEKLSAPSIMQEQP